MEREKMKENLFNLSKVVIFMLIFVVLLNVLSPIFVPKNNNSKSGIKYEMARGFYGEKKDSIDVVSIGNSDLYSAMVPLQLWNDYGMTSYVCAEPQQTIMNAYYLLNEVLSCQKPKVVILEVDELFTKNDADDLDDAVSAILRNQFPVFEYHSRWKSLSTSDFQDEVDYNTRNEAKGYVYNTEVKPFKGGFSSYMNNKEKRGVMTKTTEYYLNKFVELARSNGADVMFVCYPSATTWTNAKHQSIQYYAEKNKIQFVDFNISYAATGFNWVTDSRDGGNHLNYTGATKMTKYIGELLKKNYKLSDYRGNPDYEQWDQDYQSFMKKNEKQK